jgi:hypothetical protein
MNEKNGQAGLRLPTALPGLFISLFFTHESEENFFRDAVELLPDYTALHPMDILQTHRLMGGIFEVAVEMGSGAMIYIPSSIKAVP